MKVGILLNIKPLFEQLLSKEMDIASAYEIAKFARPMAEHLNALDAKRIELVKKFGEQQENGAFSVTDEKKKEKFTKAFEKLLNEEVDIEPLDPRVLKVGPVKIQDVLALMPIFKQ
jgi:hypothetical protein